MRLPSRLAGAFVAVSLGGCAVLSDGVAASSASSEGWFEPLADDVRPVTATIHVEVDTRHPALSTTHREPQAAPCSAKHVSGGSVDATAFAKNIPARPGWVWVDLFFVNHEELALSAATVTVHSSALVADVGEDPWAESATAAPIAIGGIAAHGVAHTALAIRAADAPTALDLTLDAATTERSARSSSPISVSPDGAEVWTSLADGNAVFVLDVATNARVASIPVPARPTSVAVTADGALVLVACATANIVVVIDRKTRRILQTLDEAAGIGREPRHVVASPDGARAYVSAYVGDELTELRRRLDGTFAIEGHLALGRRPAGIALTADGNTLFAAHYLPRGIVTDNETWVSVAHTAPISLAHETVWRDLANLREARCLSQLFGQPAEKLTFEGTATQLAGVFLPPAGGLGWIPGLRIGPTAVWEFAPNVSLPGIARSTIAPGFLFFVDARKGADASVPANPLVLDLPDASATFLRCAKPEYDSESVVRQPVDGEPNAITSSGAAVPTGTTGLSEAGVSRFVAFSRGGRRALSLSYTADEIQIFDAATQHPLAQQHFMVSGSNPIGLAITPDGRKGFVAYDGSTFVSVLDLAALADPEGLPAATYVPFEYRPGQLASVMTRSKIVRFLDRVPAAPPIAEVAQIQLTAEDPLPAEVRRGKTLFSSSNPSKYPTLTASRQAACVVCHPDGGHDGGVWGTMEGERRTMSLRGGVSGRGWLHQSGTHQNILEFVKTVASERLGGTGLSEADYAALAGYVGHHIPRLQGPRVDAASASRGATVFAASCRGCHQGATLSGGRPDANDPWGGGVAAGPLLVDVGSATTTANVLIPSLFTAQLPAPSNQLYDVIRGDRELGPNDPAQATLHFRPRPQRARTKQRPPSLIDVWDYSVFFHDGKYATLAEAVEHIDRALDLGLTPEERADVTTYLKTL